MKEKKRVWRWLRWVLLVVVGLPVLGFGVLFAIALWKPAWLAPAPRVVVPPSVLAPDSVLAPLHALGEVSGSPAYFLNLDPNQLNVPPDFALRLLLGHATEAEYVGLFAGQVRQTVQATPAGRETLVTPVGGLRAGEVVSWRVPGNQLRQLTIKTSPGGTFKRQAAIAAGQQPQFLQLGDTDGDGDLDAFVLNEQEQTVSELLNDGHGSFKEGPGVSLYPHQLSSLVVGDLNGDGTADLVTTNLHSRVAGTWLNDGHGKFGTGWGVDTGPADPSPGDSDVSGDTSAALADVDGDGDLDLLFARWSRHGAVTIRFNDGTGAFGGGSTVAVDSYPLAPVLGDIDHDGDLDLVTANYGAVRNSVSIRLNDGLGGFGGGQELTVGAHPTGVLLGDVDGDGDLDLLARDDSHTVYLRLNDGEGRFPQRRTAYLSCAISAFALSDVDGDGDLDLVASVQPEALDQPARVSVWPNDGHGDLGAHNRHRQDLALPDHSRSIVLGDVDRSGTPDLLAATHDTVVVRFNDPPR